MLAKATWWCIQLFTKLLLPAETLAVSLLWIWLVVKCLKDMAEGKVYLQSYSWTYWELFCWKWSILVQEDRGASQLHAQLLNSLRTVDRQQEGLEAGLGAECGQDGEVLGENTTWRKESVRVKSVVMFLVYRWWVESLKRVLPGNSWVLGALSWTWLATR